MLELLTVDKISSVTELETTFSEVFKQKNELINTLLSNPYVKVYTYSVDKKVVGFIQYEDIYDRYELDNIFVLEKYRRKKIGSLMLEFMINEAKKNKVLNITLEVRKDNAKAISLYKKYGFIEKAIRNKYYGDCDGILMEKEMM